MNRPPTELRRPEPEELAIGVRSIRYTDDDVRRAVAASKTMANALRMLGLAPMGGNYRTLNAKIRKLNLDTSHLVGQSWSRGVRRTDGPRRPLAELLQVGVSHQSHNLRTRLIRSGLKGAFCEMCGLAEWNGKPIPLELDHVNGRYIDNRLKNLRILCPNCMRKHRPTAGRTSRRMVEPPYPNWQRNAS